MPFFLLSYDLRKNRNYQGLYDALDEAGGFSPLESVWLLEYAKTVSHGDVLAFFKEFVDDDDGLLVIAFDKRPAAFKCKSGTANWLKGNFG